MLRLHRGPSACAAALERALIRTPQPTRNKLSTGSSGVPKTVVASARGRPRPWRRAPAVSHACNVYPVMTVILHLPSIMRREESVATQRVRQVGLLLQQRQAARPVVKRTCGGADGRHTWPPLTLNPLFRSERDVHSGVQLAKRIARPVIRARTLRRFRGVLQIQTLRPSGNKVGTGISGLFEIGLKPFGLKPVRDPCC